MFPCKLLSVPSSLSHPHLLPQKLSSWQVTFKVTQWLFSHSSLKSHAVEFVRRKTLLNYNKRSSPNLKSTTLKHSRKNEMAAGNSTLGIGSNRTAASGQHSSYRHLCDFLSQGHICGALWICQKIKKFIYTYRNV